MTEDLESLVRRTESDIEQKATKRTSRKHSKTGWRPPKVSIAIGVWLIAILLAIFEFSEIVSFVFQPAESKIERDLASVLNTAAGSLRKYEIANGMLPPILPNPSIRGLVRYERLSDFGFKLTATVGAVTMVMDSAARSPHREHSGDSHEDSEP